MPQRVCARTLPHTEHSSHGKPLHGILSVRQILGEKAAHSMVLPEPNAQVHFSWPLVWWRGRVGNAGNQFGRAEKGTALGWDDCGSLIVFSLQTSVLAGV